nr:hypothetical protein [Micromonospora sp. DSM 115978]
MRRKYWPILATALVAVMVATLGAANPAHASVTIGPPPGYVAPGGAQTTPPDSCYVYYFAHTFPSGTQPIGSMTECIRVGGVHVAVAQCADGSIRYGQAEEMNDYRQSTVMCYDVYPWKYMPALYVWGEFHTDW